MRLKSLHILAVLLIYSPVLVLGNTHATICMTEQGTMQLEFGVDVCDSAPANTTSSTTGKDCGDCTDSKIKIGETHRVTLGNNCDLFQVQIAFVTVVNEQHILAAATPINSSTPAFNLIGSSILII